MCYVVLFVAHHYNARLYNSRKCIVIQLRGQTTFAVASINMAEASGVQLHYYNLTNIASTSAGVLFSTLIPFTSITSSPAWISPERSAAPPCITRAITIFPVSSSVLIVAPYNIKLSLQICNKIVNLENGSRSFGDIFERNIFALIHYSHRYSPCVYYNPLVSFSSLFLLL